MSFEADHNVGEDEEREEIGEAGCSCLGFG
jgi:hypothetical protein